MSTKIYEEEILAEWADLCVKEKAYPVEVVIKINSKGKYTITQIVDGRALRKRFIHWMADQFFKYSNIKPPKNQNTAEFNKLWATPLETLLRQAVFIGGVDYDELKPKDKYTPLNGLCFNLLLRDTIEKQRDNQLVIAMPASIAKVGADVVAQGTHYRLAQRQYEAKLATQNAE